MQKPPYISCLQQPEAAFMRTIIKKIIPDYLIAKYRNYKRQKEQKLFQGDQVCCPICNTWFKAFAPFGSPQRENVRCLKCDSFERDRLLFLYLESKTMLLAEKTKIRLLHFAPEKCFYDIFSQNKHMEYIPCDLSPETYDYRGKVQVQKIDITKIPFNDDYIDVIICNHVLEHVLDDRLAMAELYRVMKKGAWGIFQVPIDYSRKATFEDKTITTPKERQIAFGQDDHVRWYGQDYTDRLKSAGFYVREDEFVKKFTSDELFRFGLQPSEIIYHCSK